MRLSTSCTNGPRSLSLAKVGTPSASLKGSHTTAHTAKQGASLLCNRAGHLTVPHQAKEQPEEADARLWRVSASSDVAAPLGCAASSAIWRCCFFRSAFGTFCMCEARGVSPLSACSTCRRNARCPLVKTANSPFPCLARLFFDSSSAKYCPLSLQMPKGPAGYPLVLSLLFASPYLP